MKKLTWVVDKKNEVEVKLGAFGRNRILLNGIEVAEKKVSGNGTIPFTLKDGRKAKMTVTSWGGLLRERELHVDGELILSEAESLKITCVKCGSSASEKDKFCQKCGAKIPGKENQLKLIRLKSARNTILALAAIFFISGVVMYFIKNEKAGTTLLSLSKYRDNDNFPKPINGRIYTVGELRKEIGHEAMSVLVTNLILAVIMLGLYFYAKMSSLVAMLIATGIYAVVIVTNAILAPATIFQGLIMKIIVISLLVKGIRSALELRKAGV